MTFEANIWTNLIRNDYKISKRHLWLRFFIVSDLLYMVTTFVWTKVFASISTVFVIWGNIWKHFWIAHSLSFPEMYRISITYENYRHRQALSELNHYILGHRFIWYKITNLKLLMTTSSNITFDFNCPMFQLSEMV